MLNNVYCNLLDWTAVQIMSASLLTLPALPVLSHQQLPSWSIISSLSHTARSIEDTSDIRPVRERAGLEGQLSYRRIVVKSVKAR